MSSNQNIVSMNQVKVRANKDTGDRPQMGQTETSGDSAGANGGQPGFSGAHVGATLGSNGPTGTFGGRAGDALQSGDPKRSVGAPTGEVCLVNNVICKYMS